MASYQLITDGHMLVARTAGDLQPELFARMIAETGARAASTGLRRVLVDHSAASVGGIDHESIRGVAQLTATINDAMAGGKLAVLLASELDYGLARVWLAYAEELLSYESQVFRDRDEALAWLRG